MEYTKESILENTNEEELFCLFEEFLVRLREKNGVLVTDGSISPESSEPFIHWVILDKTKGEIIKDMKK